MAERRVGSLTIASLPPLYRGMSAAEEMRMRARGLARVLGIPPVTFASREAAAYHLMSHMLALPTFRDRGRRNRYLNEILPNAGRLFPVSAGRFASEFVGVLGGVGATMQELPFWFTHLTNSNEQLVQEYRMQSAILTGMGLVGIAPLTLGAATVMQGVVKGASGAASRGVRGVVAGIARGAANSVVSSVTGGFARRLGAIWVIGTIVATGMKERQELVAAELVRRFNDGHLSIDLYRRAMGDDAVAPYVYFHAVRR